MAPEQSRPVPDPHGPSLRESAERGGDSEDRRVPRRQRAVRDVLYIFVYQRLGSLSFELSRMKT